MQEYIKAKDFDPGQKKEYFLKLAEEVGELSNAIRKNAVRNASDSIKGTIDEEIWDVIYYSIALANCYGIDLETAIKEKETINNIKYSSKIRFEFDR